MKLKRSQLDTTDLLTNPKYLSCPNCDMQSRDEIMEGKATGEETEFYFHCPDCHAEFYQYDSIPGFGYLDLTELEEPEEVKENYFEAFLGESKTESIDDDYDKAQGKCVVCWDDMGDPYDGICDICLDQMDRLKREEEDEENWIRHFGSRHK